MPPRRAYTIADRALTAQGMLDSLTMRAGRSFLVHWRRWWWLYNLIVLPLAFVLSVHDRGNRLRLRHAVGE
jgi:hypothetical protein